MKRQLILAFLIIAFQLTAQTKLNKVWVSATGGQRVHFDTTVYTTNIPFISAYFSLGNSNICDTNGNLTLFSDGYNIYDSSANYLDGGDTLVDKNFYIHEGGWSLYSQSSIFLPMDSGIYYFITPTFSGAQFADCLANNNCFFDLLLYNVIDMKANGGAGKVVKRMMPLIQNTSLSKTQMMACRHSNGKDWWLLKQAGDSNIVYKFLFTQDSIFDYGRQVFSSPLFGPWDLEGQSVFSVDGSKYAATVKSFDSKGIVSIFDFDRCYGLLSNFKIIHAPPVIFPPDTTQYDQLTTGLAYSPGGRFLYVSLQYDIYQYDTQDTTWYLVAGMDTSYAQFQGYSTIYLGPDSKLYIGNYGGTSKQMSVIDNPDVKGAGCNFCPRCLRFPDYGAGTPPCMPNYVLGAQVCWPESTSDLNKEKNYLEVYPNPTNSQINVRYKETRDTKLQIINMLGVVVKEVFLSKDVQHILTDINNLTPGVYTYRQIDNGEILNTGKLVIVN